MDGIKEASYFLNKHQKSKDPDSFMAYFRDRHSQFEYYPVLRFEFGDILKESDIDEVSKTLNSYGYKIKIAISDWEDVAKCHTGNPRIKKLVFPNYQPIKTLYVSYDESFLNDVNDVPKPKSRY